MKHNRRLIALGLLIVAAGIGVSIAFPNSPKLFETEWVSPTGAGLACVLGFVCVVFGIDPTILDRIPFLRKKEESRKHK